MSVNFFQTRCKTGSNNAEFGICDNIPNSPAYIDETNSDNWIGIVRNPHRKFAEFYAIDNCLNLRRSNNSLESTCDGVLKESTNLTFLELKEMGSGGWFRKGKAQIANTISLFKAHHNIEDFSNVSAHVCNNLKPLANSSRAVSLQMFKDETGLILRDEQEITI